MSLIRLDPLPSELLHFYIHSYSHFHFHFTSLYIQLPLLEIDGLRMTQSQAIVRYLARRANFNGMSTAEEVMCDMYAEAVNDMLGMLLKAPWTRMKKKRANEEEKERKEFVSADEMLFEKEETDEAKQHIDATRMKWHAMLGPKLEQRLQENNAKMRNVGSDTSSSHDSADASACQGPCLIGEDLTYADTLVAHLVTWLIEEIGCSCVEKYPNVLRLQQRVVKLPGMVAYLGSPLHYGVGDDAYVNEVTSALGR